MTNIIKSQTTIPISFSERKYMKRVLLFILGGALLSQTVASAQGKFSGYMFGDYYYNFAKDPNLSSIANSGASSASPGGTAFQAFQIRRVYFTYDNDISEKFTTRFRLEVDPSASLFSSNKIGAYVKDAYLTWKNVFSGSNLTFGIQPNPPFDASEGAWGYRSLEKTIMDLRGIAPSRDYGIALKGKLTGDGVFNYWLMFANGSGNAPETDKYKRYYAQVAVKPSAEFLINLNADFQDRAQIADPYNAGKKVSDGSFTASAFLAYSQTGVFKVGFEGFTQSTSTGYNDGTALKSKTALGLSFWASVNLQSDLALVARYDNFDPNTDSKSRGDLRNLIIAGLDWKVEKNVSIMPNVYYETYEAPSGGAAAKAAVIGRVTFYYIF
jgi:hypothetical protein